MAFKTFKKKLNYYFWLLVRFVWFYWLAIETFLFWLINKVFYQRKHCTTVTDPLLLAPGIELAKQIRSREITSEELVRACIKRIEEVNPLINAVVRNRFEEALKEAKSADKALESGEAPSAEKCPYYGVPFTLKDCIFVKGLVCTAGIPARKNTVAPEDAVVVRRMKEAGGICLAVTNVCMWYEAYNSMYGRTSNAYDTRRMVGGSSGGEGALLSSGGSIIGIGSDIGGSVRMPCFFNGIFGHKPTGLTVDDKGTYPLNYDFQTNMHCVGPMCRYASDLRPMLKIFAGAESAASLKLDEKVDLRGVKLFYMEEIRSNMVSPLSFDQWTALKKTVRYLEKEFGLTPIRVDLPLMHWAAILWFNDLQSEKAPPFSSQMTDNEYKVNVFSELPKCLVGMSPHTFPCVGLGIVEELMAKFSNESANRRGIEAREKLQRQIATLLGSDGILLFPGHPCVAPFHRQPIAQPFNYAYTAIFNSLEVPVTQCPVGLSPVGIPTGVQVVAAKRQDRICLAVAEALEKGLGGWRNFDAI